MARFSSTGRGITLLMTTTEHDEVVRVSRAISELRAVVAEYESTPHGDPRLRLHVDAAQRALAAYDLKLKDRRLLASRPESAFMPG